MTLVSRRQKAGWMTLEEAQSDDFCFIHKANSLVFLEELREWDRWTREPMAVNAESRHCGKHVREMTGVRHKHE